MKKSHTQGRLNVVGSACHRMQQALDEALAEGVLQLPPELEAHAARCQRCAPEYQQTAELLGRLRRAAAGIDLGQVPHIVDAVMARTAGAAQPPGPDHAASAGSQKPKPVDARFVLGQVAAVAAALVLVVGGLTYTLLKVSEAVSGVKPGRVVEKVVAPLRDWTYALFRGAR